MNSFEIRWRNFRALEDTGWITIRPLTILLGPNNAGKSSLLAPILLLRQTLQSRDRSVGLLTKGRLINAGSFEDIVFERDTTRKVVFGFRFDSGGDPELAPAELELVFGPGATPNNIVLERYTIRNVAGSTLLQRTRMKTGRYSFKVKTVGDSTRSRSNSDKGVGPFGRAVERDLRNAGPDHFIFQGGPSALFRSITAQKPEASDVGLSSEVLSYTIYTGMMEQHLRSILHHLSYLGPLRQRPQRVYEVSGEAPENVGSRGQFAPEILYRGGAEMVTAASKWLKEFDFGPYIEFAELSKASGGFSFFLRRTHDSPIVNYSDTGFGISQVLPLIVQSIYAQLNSWIVAEQPEIHLNPRLEAQLADLFASTANSNKGVLVETHSEYLLLRLRRLVAEGTVNPESLAVYFVEKNRDRASIRPIEVDDLGHIDPESWPKGFFEDGLREAFALARTQAKKSADVR